VLKYPKVNKAWDKAKGGKGHYVKLARCAGHSASVCHLDFRCACGPRAPLDPCVCELSFGGNIYASA
jgi:hypothetical protein